MRQHLIKMSEQGDSLLLLLLVGSDIAFNLLHIYQHSFLQDEWTIYGRISTYLEVYHLIKLFWIVVIFGYVFFVSRDWGYIAWLLIFISLFLDDAFLLHQKIGDQFALQDNVFPFFPPRTFELAVLAIGGLFQLLILGLAYWRSSKTFRKISNDLLLFILALVFFGLIVDLATALHFGPTGIMGLVILEDGGEMLAFSLILWYGFLLAIRKGKPDQFLLDAFGQPEK